MNQRIILQELKRRLQEGAYSYQTENFLIARGIKQKTQRAILIAKAKQLVKEERRESLFVINRVVFIVSAILAVVTFILFAIVLPNQFYSKESAGWVILGGLLIVVFLFLAVNFFNSWKEKNVSKQIDLGLFPLNPFSLVAGIGGFFVFGFIFYSSFTGSYQHYYNENKIETTGVLVDGESTEVSESYLGGYRTIDKGGESHVLVKYTDKNGKTHFVHKEVSVYAFVNYYVHQTVRISYIPQDPNDIRILGN